jgi:hypothetical protein
VDQKSGFSTASELCWWSCSQGRRPIKPEYDQTHDIIGWIRERLRSNIGLEELLDTGVGGHMDPSREMLLVLRIAVLCMAKVPQGLAHDVGRGHHARRD